MSNNAQRKAVNHEIDKETFISWCEIFNLNIDDPELRKIVVDSLDILQSARVSILMKHGKIFIINAQSAFKIIKDGLHKNPFTTFLKNGKISINDSNINENKSDITRFTNGENVELPMDINLDKEYLKKAYYKDKEGNKFPLPVYFSISQALLSATFTISPQLHNTDPNQTNAEVFLMSALSKNSNASDLLTTKDGKLQIFTDDKMRDGFTIPDGDDYQEIKILSGNFSCEVKSDLLLTPTPTPVASPINQTTSLLKFR